MKNVGVGTIIFRKKDDTWEFLVMKRISKIGGFWQVPGGGVEKTDKTLLDTAYREVFEEAGIKKEQVLSIIEDVNHFFFDKFDDSGNLIKKIEEYVFAFEVDKDAVVNIDDNVELEHEDYKWVSYKEALELFKFDSQKNSLNILYSLLSELN
ncbi:MAG: NUDIX pyrophosphatase [archaeon]